jgi:hypothetical protein
MSNKIRSQIMGEQHVDIKYLMQDDIGVVISKGLASTYETKPKNPIEYFAKWLLNHRETEREAQKVSSLAFITYFIKVEKS